MSDETAKFEKMSPEELRAYCDRTEEEIAEIEKVTQRFDAWLDDLPNTKLWEDLQVATLELGDALDDLNDNLQACEEAMRKRRFRPGWIPIDKERALIWDGFNLRVDDGNGKGWVRLFQQPKAIRVQAVTLLPALIEELTRDRRPV